MQENFSPQQRSINQEFYAGHVDLVLGENQTTLPLDLLSFLNTERSHND